MKTNVSHLALFVLNMYAIKKKISAKDRDKGVRRRTRSPSRWWYWVIDGIEKSLCAHYTPESKPISIYLRIQQNVSLFLESWELAVLTSSCPTVVRLCAMTEPPHRRLRENGSPSPPRTSLPINLSSFSAATSSFFQSISQSSLLQPRKTLLHVLYLPRRESQSQRPPFPQRP